MDFAEFLRAFFALAFTVGLAFGALALLRRFGPDTLARFGRPMKADRRLAVLETLVLDPSRRLVLVACDGEEKLLLLGEGRVVAPVTLPKGRG